MILKKEELLSPEEGLKVLEERLEQSDVPTDINLKKWVYEILSAIQYGALQGQYEMPGMLVVLGYDHNNPDHFQYYSETNKEKNIFRRRFEKTQQPINLNTEMAGKIVKKIKHFDGAILIDPEGYITDNWIYLKKIDPEEVLDRMGVSNDRDLSERLGLIKKGNARQMAAACASYIMQDTTTYTLSKDWGVIRIFEKGRPLYSQIRKEMFPSRAEKKVLLVEN